MWRNRTITVEHVSSEEISTFKCITYKEYLKNKDHYNKFRDPKSFNDIMKGVYLIVNSPDESFWDTYICSQLFQNQPYADYRIVKAYKIQNGDIIHYKKIDVENAPVLQLTFETEENVAKYNKKKNGIFYVPNKKNNKHLRIDTLYDALNYCYVGKHVSYKGSNYYIVKVKPKWTNRIQNIVSTVTTKIKKITNLLKR